MKGDFTRDTFDASKHFSRVLKQQGRVELDADWNEQGAIQQHRLRSLAMDLIGPHGGPGDEDGENLGFGIVDVNTLSNDEKERLEGAQILPLKLGDFLISKGRYYVNGILCENEDFMPYLQQPDWPGKTELAKGNSYLVYLDVWERHITSLEDRTIREVALGALGPDTATRAKVVWQVKVTSQLADEKTDIPNNTTCKDVEDSYWSGWLAKWQPENRGQLKAKAIQPTSSELDDSCITPPESRYRGAENQLYRVEIHRKGKAGEGASFKWSRDNGSIVFPVSKLAGNMITLGYLGRDNHHSLEPGQWVELVDDDIELREREIYPLGKVKEVNNEEMTITVEWPVSTQLPAYHEEDYESKHVLLRRWDQKDSKDPKPLQGDIPITEGTTENDWIDLEEGVQIQFQPGATYRIGDYWLIPARTATGNVEWPGEVGKPDPLPPHGVEHHYAPLWLISVGDDGNVTADASNDCRHKISGGIDPGSDLKVHNLAVSGDLTVDGTVNGREVSADGATLDAHIARMDNPHLVTAGQVGALTVDEYDLRRTSVHQVHFDNTNVDGAPKSIVVGFRPALILASGACHALLGEKFYGGTFSSFADLRQGLLNVWCSGIKVNKTGAFSGVSDWQLDSTLDPYLCSASFVDRTVQSVKGELFTVNITDITASPPNDFNVKLTLRRTLAADGFFAVPLENFLISFVLYCLG